MSYCLVIRAFSPLTQAFVEESFLSNEPFMSFHSGDLIDGNCFPTLMSLSQQVRTEGITSTFVIKQVDHWVHCNDHDLSSTTEHSSVGHTIGLLVEPISI
ncbi:hypothetical protein J9231_16095 [Providencia rettgeri]|uniref:hypothetical protein n=1 Tax=Providencia rettgeri TaxID=587 RepID=UPI001B369C1F|nr:hypothetical protein [Providencia rettgeri]MBQ0329364.1 hypothetical protein [Providencia rettgeri]